VRWRDDRQEVVTLFGANYVLPTASDYRAAGYLHADRKHMIDEDMAQFKSVKWRSARGAIRISCVALGSDSSWQLSPGPLLEPQARTEWTGTPPGQLPSWGRSLAEYSVWWPEPCLGWWRAQKIGFRLPSQVHEGLRTENKERSLSAPSSPKSVRSGPCFCPRLTSHRLT
jgi:hypothetical protein